MYDYIRCHAVSCIHTFINALKLKAHDLIAISSDTQSVANFKSYIHSDASVMLDVPARRRKKSRFEPRPFKQHDPELMNLEGQPLVQSLTHAFHSHRADNGTRLQKRTLGSCDLVVEKTPFLTADDHFPGDSIFDFFDGLGEEGDGDAGSNKEDIIQVPDATKAHRVSL